MGRKFGFSWSWRRATGLSAAKGRISRAIGIPLTRSGRRQKVGRLLGGWLGLSFLLGGARRRTAAAGAEPAAQASAMESPPTIPQAVATPLTICAPAIVQSTDATSVASDRLHRGGRLIGAWIGRAARFLVSALRQLVLGVDETLAAIAVAPGSAAHWSLRAAAIGVTLFVGWLMYLTAASVL
jgi:hypothetical protein